MANEEATVSQTVNTVTVTPPAASTLSVTSATGGTLTSPESTASLVAVTVAPSTASLTIESKLAPKESPIFTGTPTAPTASAGTNTTQIATTAFVNSAITLENTLAEMNDVNFTSLGDNEILQYDTSSSKWLNQTLSEAGIASTSSLTSHTSDTSNPHSVTATQVNLGNVTNESKGTMFTNPTFTGTPLAPTASAATNNTQLATTQYVTTAITNLIDSSPATLNTLNELAAALNDDANFAGTITSSIATKLPLAGGTMTGNIVMAGSQTVDGRDLSVDGAKLDGIDAGAKDDQTAAEIRALVDSASDSNVFTDADHTKLDGIAASANNYVHPTSGTGVSPTLSGANVLATLTSDSLGHVTAATARTLTLANLGYTGATDANNYVLPAATDLALGGIKTGYVTNNKQYPVDLDSSSKAFVNVPWTDTIYTLPLATSGARGGVKIGYTENGKNYPVELSSEKMFVNVPWTDTVYTLPLASDGTRGGVQIGYPLNSSGKKYPVQLGTGDDAEQMYVHVTWTDTKHLSLLDDVMLSSVGGGELIVYNSGAWHNKTLTEAGILPLAGGTMTGNLTLSYAYPRINLTDTNNDSDYSIINNDGSFSIYDVTNASHRFLIAANGNATFAETVTGKSFHQDTQVNSTFYSATFDDNVTISGILKIPDGSVSAPALAFTSETNTGIYATSSQLNFAVDGSTRLYVGSAGIISAASVYSGTTGHFRNVAGTWKATTGGANKGWEFLNTAGSPSNSIPSATLSSTGTLVLNGKTTATKIELYETYTDTSNYERSFFKHDSSFLEIGTEALGTGTASGIKVRTTGVTALSIAAGGLVTVESRNSSSSTNILSVGGSNNGYMSVRHVEGKNSSSNAYGPIYINHLSNNNVFLASGGGGVGIGITSTPRARLDLGANGVSNLSWGTWSELGEESSHNTLVIGNNVYVDSSSTKVRSTSSNGYRAIRMKYNEGVTFHALNASASADDVVANERMRIAPDGNVGIGTTTPSQKLEVAGDIFINAGAAGGRSLQLQRTGATNPWKLVQGHTATNDFEILENQDTRFMLKSGGNVGIGTTAPASKVHIENTAYDFDSSPEVGDFHLMLRDLDSSVAGDAISIGFAQSTDATTVGAKISFLTEASHSRGSLVFSTSSTSNVGDNAAERMRITSAGNVGIGTTAPLAKLHIDVTTEDNQPAFKITKVSDQFENAMEVKHVTTSSARGIADFENSAGSVLYLRGDGNVGIGTTSPSKPLDVRAEARVWNGANGIELSYSTGNTSGIVASANTSGNLEFRTNIGSTAKMFIANAGNVGIGVTDPDQKLEVNGNIRIPNQGKIVFGSAGAASDYLQLYDIGTSGDLLKLVQDGNTRFSVTGVSGDVYMQGDVGIGTTTPAEKLDVKGTAKIGSNSTTNCHLIGSKGYSLTASFTTGLTVTLADHTACHVKVFISGDWANHSSVAYVGEFLIQNTGNVGSYNEPGIILTEYDNLTSDRVEAKIVDGTTDNFEIQFQAVSSSSAGIPVSAKITYHVMGDASAVS